MLVGDVDEAVGQLQALSQRRLGGRGHESNIAPGQRGRTISGRLVLQPSRRNSSGSLAKFAAKRRASSRVSKFTACAAKGRTREVLDDINALV